MSTDSVRLHINDVLVEERDAPPTTTLLAYLRRHMGLTGTKEGCAEGDCGACTVAYVDTGSEGGPAYRAVNACLVLLPMMHGKRVYTVEGLRRNGDYHLVQEAMTQALGSQCGYCTPGFVMSMFEACYRGDLDAPWKLDDQICGNLCRCTGYRPIRDATRDVAGARPDDDFRAHLEGPHAGPQSLAYARGEDRFYLPTSLGELAQIVRDHPNPRFVAGATDLGLEVTKRHARYDCLISLEGIDTLRHIREIDGGWSFGATVTLSDLEAACEDELPILSRMLRFFGSRQIKNLATLGGNLCNASPIGDTPPVLLALDATIVLQGPDGERRVPVDQFFRGYRKTALGPGEIVSAVEVERPTDDAKMGSYKVSKRRELDISAVCAAMVVHLDASGIIQRARVAYGGMAATPSRAFEVEKVLVGRAYGEVTFEIAAGALDTDFSPIDDHRGSAWYRATVAKNLLRGFYEETRTDPQRSLVDRPSSTVMVEVAP